MRGTRAEAMARKRFDNLDPEKQDRLFAAAAAEFAEKGYDAASLNRILDNAGISKGSMYYYFDDRSDLFSTVLEKAVEKLLKAVGGFSLEELTSQNFWDRLDEIWLRCTAFLSQHTWYAQLARLLYRLRKHPAGVRRTSRIYKLAEHWTKLTIERGQELGVLRTDLPCSLLVEAALAVSEAGDRWLFENWDDLSETERTHFAKEEMELLRRILMPSRSLSAQLKGRK